MLYISDNDVSANEMSIHLIISYFFQINLGLLILHWIPVITHRRQSGIQGLWEILYPMNPGALCKQTGRRFSSDMENEIFIMMTMSFKPPFLMLYSGSQQLFGSLF